MAVARWLAPRVVLAGLIGLFLTGAREADRADAQAARGPGRAATPAAPHVHQTPKGWRFTWPKGDPVTGREVFQKLECHSCHEVRGESFPAPSDGQRVGPERSMRGPLHPPEYFAESIINPSAVIEPDRGYAAPDGSSRMPSNGDSLTLQETVDLVAYLRQLRSPPAARARGAPAVTRPTEAPGNPA
jgi:mono/diheme cytochrome c family protein